MSAFHEVLFPLDVALGSRGGPQRITDVVTLSSGREERNQRWFHSRRKYNAGYGIKSLDAIAAVTEFFEERRGRLHGFRWRDHSDFKSCPLAVAPGPLDQDLGFGDGVTSSFQIRKRYGANFNPYWRDITKPVSGSVRVALDGLEQVAPAFNCDYQTGLISFQMPPASGSVVTAGFLFDVPVRFDSDYLAIDLASFHAGEIPDLPVIEILP
ncbi:MAG: DUF2460 domain-containing protein [Hyphomicrobiales bacterium]|nr:DUF2460 domain-containing protein [Hyphomicrobiales bacterium]